MKFFAPARLRCVGVLLALLCSTTAYAQTSPKKVAEGAGTAEQRTVRAYESARANPLDLHAFLARMPKGADLHYHLGGGIYAETFIRDAAEDGLCVDLASHSLVKPAGAVQPAPAQPDCGIGTVPAAKAFADQNLYDTLIDAFSMRSFVSYAGVSGHDHFFDTFGKFGNISGRHEGEWLDEIAARAASQNEQYLELMQTPDFSHAARIASEIGWRDDLGQFRSELLARGLRDDIAGASAARDAAEASRRKIEHCGEPQEAPACKITIRYLYQVLRGFPREVVFAQTLLGFETAMADPRFVGINYVMPEDGRVSMADYALHMKIVGFLHSLYPKVHISLHAGELAEGLVPPEGLCCHIRLALEEAHAERIGHGVDAMQEDRPYELLKEMAAKHVMVEINLTSNDVILGVAGKDHPLPDYRKYRVPVALSTDDEGVSRIDLTHEYVRAAETYSLSYADLKQMVRTGLEHNFLPGASLWREPDVFSRPAAACANDAPGAAKPSPGCVAFLKSSEKAQQQWELERRFREFEAGF
ncbi:MAG: adenosine deaminase [Acidobacteriia bacterium]|nr:adenosine deaminase [Terriglobia bacterium]